MITKATAARVLTYRNVSRSAPALCGRIGRGKDRSQPSTVLTDAAVADTVDGEARRVDSEPLPQPLDGLGDLGDQIFVSDNEEMILQSLHRLDGLDPTSGDLLGGV